MNIETYQDKLRTVMGEYFECVEAKFFQYEAKLNALVTEAEKSDLDTDLLAVVTQVEFVRLQDRFTKLGTSTS